MDMLQSLGMSKDLIADLLINIVSIIVLYLVVKKLAYKPVKKFLDARTQRVEAQKTEAEDRYPSPCHRCPSSETGLVRNRRYYHHLLTAASQPLPGCQSSVPEL